MRTRGDWDQHWMSMAWLVSERATCPRRSVGAVIVRDNRMLTTGYNGSPSGLPHCTDDDVGCLTDDQGRCKRTIHAEANAIITAARHGVSIVGGTLYVTDQPCEGCTLLVLNSGIVRVVFDRIYQTMSDGVISGIHEMVEHSEVIFHQRGAP